MSAQLPRPGVEVVQQFRSVSPSVVTPTLVPCVVGVAKQIVDVLVPDGAGGNSLNAGALITLPASFIAKAATGDPAVYTGLDGLVLELMVNNGLGIQVGFSDPTADGLTPATMVDQVNKAFDDAQVSSILGETVGDTRFQLRTVGLGQFQSIYIGANTSPAVASALGIGIGKTYAGIEDYNQFETEIPVQTFPDPRNNLAELAIETSSIRVFLSTEGAGVGLRELKRTEAFLRSGTVDDAAVVTGSVDLTGLTYGAPMNGKIITLKVDDGDSQSYTVAGSPANAAALIALLLANLDGVTPSVVAGSNFARFTSNTTGADSKLEFVGGTLLVDFGIANATVDYGESIAAVDDGDGNVVTPLLQFAQENFAATPTQAVLTASAAPTFPIPIGSTLILSDGRQPQVVVFNGEATIGAVVTAISAVMGTAAGGQLTPSDAAGSLRLTHTDFGDESLIEVIGGTALANLDPGGTPTLIAGAAVRGVAFKPLPGDELYIDGAFFANIVQVAPGAVATRLKIDRQIAINTNVGARFYIQAKGLVAGGSASRPYPDLTVDTEGNLTLKHSFIRDPFGNVSDVRAPVYVTYRAVRKDVSSSAVRQGLLRFDDTAQLEDALAPLNTDNPLGLGLFYALINAPGAQVTGLGVDEVSADEPFGTLSGFTRASEFLESVEVYAIAPLTHDPLVGQIYSTHVSAMSAPDQKGERIVLWNPEVPTRRLDTLVATGANGDGLTTTTFDTKVATLAALVQNAGVSPVGTIATTKGLYLDIEGDDKKYSVSAVTGGQITIRTTFASSDNADGFYSTTALVLPLISQTFAIRVRGAELVTVSGQRDKNAVAETMQLLGQSFLNRRFWMTFPDKCASTIDGVEQTIDGFYMNAAIAGMIAQQPPQQSFTNFPMTGFTRVIGSNDTYSEKQLNVMAAGGAYIIIQDGQGTPLFARMALTTDLTSVETRTDSITKVVDFSAKFLRRGLRNFIGRFNITQGFLDSVGSVIQGLLGVLVDTGVLVGATLNNIVQDEDAPDTVLVDVTLDVPYPCNYIRLTLVV